ncbi:N-acetylglucosamine kinase [Devosia pacifica]|uniref:N-acetylglucosamine kinase n=1 Tax=Devosia pacifica TaxID=1335967 RepID=A0A918SB29_9HYPH|nr:BadF/BadG/BcrA/BcrD ATPase family protein [Devosia pacifica]GHA30766.1 N-acetylglucosamine kinase [Devosia pacifica]
MPTYYLGVDGGGTNCRVRLADKDLNTLAEVKGGRSNLQIDEGLPAYNAITTGAREAFAEAGIDFAETANTFAVFGMAGGRMHSARAAFEAREWPFAAVKVFDDIDIAHAGALGGSDGGVIIVGTGSAALGIVDGKRYQAGGWGFQIGDQMSGAILGRELVRYAVEAEDGLREHSPLTRAVIEALGGDNQAVMSWSFGTGSNVRVVSDDAGESHSDLLIGRAPAEFARFMPMLFDYLDKDDPVAHEMIRIQLDYVDTYVRWFKSCSISTMAIVGGFGERLFPQFEDRYGEFVRRSLYEPLHGALILAKQHFPAA